ncbi:MAG: sulfotransferase domain-containing protein, partial [Candidatus Paceibacterales bacterium]
SIYHHWKNYNNPVLKFDDVFEKIIRSDKPTAYPDFNRQWMENKKGLPILYLQYEEVLADKRRAIETLASFLNVEVSEAKIDEVLELSSFENMKLNQNKFGEQPKERLPGLVYDQFIRNGKPGEGKAVLTEEQLEYCRKKTDLSLHPKGLWST